MGSFTLVEALLIFAAGLGAGAINAAVGSGTLITFPALVAFGVPPQTATMSNALGLIPGNVASSFGYRKQMAGYGKQVATWLPASILGSIVGALLLVVLPSTTFEAVVPVLIVLAVIMVIGQPFLKRALAKRAEKAGRTAPAKPEDTSSAVKVAALAAIFFTAIYGGYFAAAQGVLLVGLLGVLTAYSLQQINGFKNVLVLGVNTVAAIIYMIVGFDKINWTAVLLVAVGSLIGGYAGAKFAQKLPDPLLRGIIVVLSIIAFFRIIQL